MPSGPKKRERHMSLHGTQSPPPKKKRGLGGLGGMKPTGGGSSSSGPSSSSSGGYSFRPSGGSSYTPPPSIGPSQPSPFGGFKFPGMGGGGIFGPEPTGPGFTANWTDSTRLMVAIGAFALILLAAGALIFGLLQGGSKTPSPQKQATVVTKFVPPTTTSGGKTDVPITFTDGTTADLLYNSSVDLGGLGVTLIDSGTMGQFARGGRQFQIDHGGASFVASEPTPAPHGL